ncbi:hypothetical protein HN51_062859 [Arachis hypogaea]
MRSQEALFDLRSTVGEMVLQSPLRLLERSAASVLTREIFLLLRQILSRAYTLKNGSFFKYSCMRIETLEIPCDHIILVLVHLDIIEMLASVVLERELCVLASARVDDFVDVTAKVINEISHFKGKTLSPTGEGVDPRCTQRRAQKVGYEETDDNEYENVMEEVGEVDWMKTHWSGQDANEKDEDDSCEKDHYLDVSLSKA